MIKKLVRQMLTAQILSALTVSLCLLIDNIMIGRYLGERALTAYGLANPMLLVIGAVGSMLCAGAQVACSKSLGRGDQEETNVGYSSTVAAAAVFSLAFTALALLLRVPIARLLGAGKEPALLTDTSTYMAGFSIGAPATMGALVLVPFLQMAGQSNLLIVAVLGMTVADVAFDLLNVLVFHGGMFGKKCVFSFSLKRIKGRKVKELFANGVPTMFGMASSVAMVFAVNQILLNAGGKAAVAAFSVVTTLVNASNCISTGSGGVALTLSGVLSNEEDRGGLAELLRVMARCALVLGVVVTALLIAFARPCVELFIPYACESQTLAIQGLRIYALGLTFCCLSNVLRNCYQGTGRVRMMEAISVCANGALPILTALLFSLIAGVDGVWFLFMASEALTVLGVFAYVCWKKGRFTTRAEDILLLREDFGVQPRDLLEGDPASLDEVMALSRAAETFCREHGRREDHDHRQNNRQQSNEIFLHSDSHNPFFCLG